MCICAISEHRFTHEPGCTLPVEGCMSLCGDQIQSLDRAGWEQISPAALLNQLPYGTVQNLISFFVHGDCRATLEFCPALSSGRISTVRASPVRVRIGLPSSVHLHSADERRGPPPAQLLPPEDGGVGSTQARSPP
jgi:hypothetical protein